MASGHLQRNAPGAPHVSVVIPAYNAADSIGGALASVFAQTFKEVEVIVVDDGSTDGTAAVVEAMGGRVTLIRQVNGGPGAARNTGIRASRGPLIAFLDADDCWLPHKIEAQVAYFRVHPQTGLLHAATTGRAEDAAGPRVFDTHPRPPRHVFCDLFHTDYDIATLTVMVRRDVLDTVGLFDERREVHVEDWDLWLRIAARFPIGYLPQPAAVRVGGGSMSADIEKTFRGQAEVIAKNVAMCRTGCPLHRSQPAACLQRRWYRFHWELGYARLRDGRRAAARAAFVRALARRPLSGSAWMQLGAAFATERGRAAARRVLGVLGQPNALSAPHAERRGHSSMIDDTVYRRARRSAVRTLHVLETAAYRVRAGERRRILFEASSPMSFAVFRPVYERLRDDARFEFWFTAARTWDVERLYSQVGITRSRRPGRAGRLDEGGRLSSTPTSGSRPGSIGRPGASTCSTASRASTASTRRSRSRRPFAPTTDSSSRTRIGCNRYVEAGLVGAGLAGRAVGRATRSSTPRGRLARRRRRILAELGLDARRPTVLYAPTWSPHSSLNRIGTELPPALAAAGYNVIVKLHDRSLDLAHGLRAAWTGPRSSRRPTTTRGSAS